MCFKHIAKCATNHPSNIHNPSHQNTFQIKWPNNMQTAPKTNQLYKQPKHISLLQATNHSHAKKTPNLPKRYKYTQINSKHVYKTRASKKKKINTIINILLLNFQNNNNNNNQIMQPTNQETNDQIVPPKFIQITNPKINTKKNKT